jgi:hypothetical protein
MAEMGSVVLEGSWAQARAHSARMQVRTLILAGDGEGLVVVELKKT